LSARAAPPPQLTAPALVLGLVPSAVLAGANAYRGLFAGMTVVLYRVARVPESAG